MFTNRNGLSIVALLIFSQISQSKILTTSKPCFFQKINDGVCICNSSYCDTLDVPDPNYDEYLLISTTKEGKRFSIQSGQLANNDQVSNSAEIVTLKINSEQKYNKILGFGGAFTDAVTENLKRMTPSLRNNVYQSYFDRKFGAAFSIVRIPIGGCDFSVSPWAYNEFPEDDLQLSNITQLDPRDKQRIQFLKDLEKSSQRNDLKYMFATWSPPKWMKK